MSYKDPEKRRLVGAASAKRARDRRRQERVAQAFGVDPAAEAVNPIDPGPLGPLLPESIRLREMADVVALLETAARMVAGYRGATPIEKARVFAQIANAALRGIEAASYAPRIAALEETLNPRRLRALS